LACRSLATAVLHDLQNTVKIDKNPLHVGKLLFVLSEKVVPDSLSLIVNGIASWTGVIRVIVYVMNLALR